MWTQEGKLTIEMWRGRVWVGAWLGLQGEESFTFQLLPIVVSHFELQKFKNVLFLNSPDPPPTQAFTKSKVSIHMFHLQPSSLISIIMILMQGLISSYLNTSKNSN